MNPEVVRIRKGAVRGTYPSSAFTASAHEEADLRIRMYIFYISISTQLHINIHMFIHTYIHTYIHTFIHTYIHMYKHIYISIQIIIPMYIYIYTNKKS